jgi:rhodanese-related sulfurtransferase
MKTAIRVILQAAAIVAVSAALAVGTNLARPDGIPLVADVPYDIFAPCVDSEVQVEAVTGADLAAAGETVLYVDARPAEEYAREHAKAAVNAPYSVLFGAADDDLARVKAAVAERGAARVVVYGTLADPSADGGAVELAEQLAKQLVEAGIRGVEHVAGGLETLKKSGVNTVQGDDGAAR